MICACLACRFRRLGPPLTLIALGVLLLAHMLRPAFTAAEFVGGFLVYVGAFLLVLHVLPRATAPAHAARGSLFSPFLLLTLGGLILLRHLRPALPLGAWVANYWPLLLILWGLVRLVEHYTRPPRLRPGFSGGEVLLLIVIVLGGLAFSGIYRFGHSRWANAWGVNVNDWNPFYQSYSFTSSARAALPSGQPVRISGWRGSVQLQAAPPGSPNAISAAVSDTVHSDTAADAQQQFQSAQPAIRFEGGQLTVFPAGPDFNSNVEADLVLTLPASTPVDIGIQNGDIAVSGWRANVTIHTQHGAISVDQVQGAVGVSGGGGDVALSNISGPADLSGAFFGDLSFRNLAQGLHLHAGHADLRLASLPGGLDVDTSRIGIDGARGIALDTRDQAVDIKNFTGPLQVSTRNQPVDLASAAVPSAPITVDDQNADITLTLPPASAFLFQAHVRNATATNPFPSAPTPAVTLSTSNGSIDLRKAAAP